MLPGFINALPPPVLAPLTSVVTVSGEQILLAMAAALFAVSTAMLVRGMIVTLPRRRPSLRALAGRALPPSRHAA